MSLETYKPKIFSLFKRDLKVQLFFIGDTVTLLHVSLPTRKLGVPLKKKSVIGMRNK